MRKMTEREASIIKGMINRGDKQQWIVAWFGGIHNHDHIAEIKKGLAFTHISPTKPDELPPLGPYASGRSVHHALIALNAVKALTEQVVTELTRASDEDDDE